LFIEGGEPGRAGHFNQRPAIAEKNRAQNVYVLPDPGNHDK
jgi:hypothetical protein